MAAKNRGVPSLQITPKQAQQQNLMMSAHMQQALHLLQIPTAELQTYLEEQMALNPILQFSEDDAEKIEQQQESSNDTSSEKEIDFDDHNLTILKKLDDDFKDFFSQNETPSFRKNSQEEKLKTYLDNSVCYETTLYEHVCNEARETFDDPKELQTAEIIAGYLNESGFIETSLEEIAKFHHLTKERCKQVLSTIQSFEPYGLGASTIQECFLIQLRCLKKAKTVAYRIIESHYDELLHNHLPAIQKALGCSMEEIRKAIEHDISKLDLHPGRYFLSSKAQTISADVTIRQEGDQLFVDVEKEHITKIRPNRRYLKMLEDPEVPSQTKQYIKNHFLSAKWLLRNLQQRYSTVERIAESLANHQRQFFLEPEGKLVPLTMKMVADELNLHESTITRTVSNKYLNSPRGLMSLRDFFTTGLTSDKGEEMSSSTIREAIQELIRNEDSKHPLSDDQISEKLHEKGMNCARRTVAKYRIALKLGNTRQRRKY